MPAVQPADLDVKTARDRYLAENGFDTAGYTAGTFQVHILGIGLTFRNTAARKHAIPMHDLHHVVTGFGTDLMGEGEISAWEIGAGGIRNPTLFALLTGGAALGLFLSPRRMWRAWRAGRTAKELFGPGWEYERLLTMRVGELRRALGVPEEGAATHAPALHRGAPGPVAPGPIA